MQEQIIEGYRLSIQQKNLWLLQQESLAYRAQCAVLLEGNLNADLFREALEEVVRRQEVLRTAFRRLPGMEVPLQVIEQDARPCYREVSLCDWGSAEQQVKVDELFLREGSIPFSYEMVPLARFTLLTLSATRRVLLISMPSLCGDVWTLGSLVREISLCYRERAEGSALPENPVQYADFAEWQGHLLQAEDAEEARAYWERQTALARQPLTLPLERRALQAPQFDPASISFIASPGVVGKIDSVVGKYDASFSAFLLACWQTLLWRLTGRPDPVIGCLSDGRKLGPLKDALGLFGQYLPVSCHIEEGYSFDELLRRADDAISGAYGRQEYNAEGFSFPIAFEYLSWPDETCVAGVRFSMFRQYVCADRFKLKLSAIRAGDDLSLDIHFDPAFYSYDAVELLSEQFETLLSNLIAYPQVRVGEAEIIGEAERRILIEAWNDTKAEYPRNATVHELFEAQVERAPDAVALVFGEEELTYRELDRRANRLARHLKRSGVGCESRVGVLLDRSIRSVEALLGILKAGGVYVPLDPAQPRQRLEFMIEDARMSALVTEQRQAVELRHEGVEVVCLDSDRESIARESGASPCEKLSHNNAAYVIYTSGSTGKPKGVLIEHGSAVNYALALRKTVYGGYEGGPLRVSLNAPMVFDASIKQILHLLFGHRLILVPEEVRRDGERMLGYLVRHHPDVFDCTPTHLRMLLAAGFYETEGIAPVWILVGGEALDEATWALLVEHAETRYFNHYGPTECTVNTTICEVDRRSPQPRIGRPLANTQVFLLDARSGLAPTGVAGELHISGAGLARGYINQAGWTAEKFIPNPFSREPGERLYRSGDLARYWPDGLIEFVGRTDHQVKVRGNRVDLGEIEAALRERLEVMEAIVKVCADEFGGERLVAYLVLIQPSSLSVEVLRRYMRELLPDYMVPSAFVFMKDLPLTRNGKLDRDALPEPEPERSDARQSRAAAPRTLVEEILVGIWAEVLHIERVSIGDNFFQLGGHSLLATQLISRVREAFKIDLPLRSLFETSTVAELAERVQEAISDGQKLRVPPIGRAPRDARLRLSFAQQRLWFLDQLEPGNPAYFSVRPLQLRGRLSVPGLEQSLGEIVRRHEILRTSFPVAGTQPAQIIAPAQSLTLPIVDLSELPVSECEATTRQIMREESRRPFDLSRLPLLRLTLLRPAAESHTVMFAIHHIVIDGWSMGILNQEVNQLYETFSRGKPSPLAELSIQYADFAQWQQEWLQGESLEEQLSYWRKHLADTTMLELPASRPRPATQTFNGAVKQMAIPASLSEALVELSRREGVTLYMTLLAAFKTLLYLYTGKEDIVVGTGIASRNRVEVERLIGFFINMLALRTDLSDNPSFRELLKRVREVALAAYAHQDAPFEKVVAELRSEWEPGRASLFQAVFFLQNFTTSSLELPDLSVDSWGFDPGVAHFDLALFMMETQQGLMSAIEYNTDLFDDAIIDQMSSYFEVLLERIVTDPDIRLYDITLIQDETGLEYEAIPGPQADAGIQFNFSL
jgi:amino acid adenylation domain-containing protein